MQTNAWSRREDEINETDARAINYNEREITKKKAAIFRPRSFFKLVIIPRSSETSVFPAIREIYASSKYTKTWPSDPPCPHFATLFTSRVRVGESQPIVIWLLFLLLLCSPCSNYIYPSNSVCHRPMFNGGHFYLRIVRLYYFHCFLFLCLLVKIIH